MVDPKVKEKLLEAVSYIENEAQNQQVYDTEPANMSDWSTIESEARDLRETIEDLDIDKRAQEAAEMVCKIEGHQTEKGNNHCSRCGAKL